MSAHLKPPIEHPRTDSLRRVVRCAKSEYKEVIEPILKHAERLEEELHLAEKRIKVLQTQVELNKGKDHA